ncbi:MAG: UPF0280 family protein [Candidatus Marinimicrobia bacterium]|nr:UPF0280 family protein [Candidatus Neomarinimicrobiota bacterium]
MIYQSRDYRKFMQSGRFDSFIVKYKEIDLWIGVSRGAISEKLKEFALEKIKKLRDELDEYIKHNSFFLTSLETIKPNDDMPSSVKEMCEISEKTGIGPMSAVAGYFAEFIGKEIKKRFKLDEIVIENGGDIFLDIIESLTITIYAGDSPLSEKVGINIDCKFSPLGISTSSGTVGHSLSFGKADAVMIACKNSALADSFATKFCNAIKSVDDIDSVLKLTKEYSDIISAVIIYGEKIGVRGKFDVEF